jgi:hypothetical protein
MNDGKGGCEIQKVLDITMVAVSRSGLQGGGLPWNLEYLS